MASDATLESIRRVLNALVDATNRQTKELENMNANMQVATRAFKSFADARSEAEPWDGK